MKILFVHNKYLLRGGEDAVVENEIRILKQRGHSVRSIFFDNQSIAGTFRLFYFIRLFFNWEARKKLVREIEQQKPDLIHIHNLFYTASPSILFLNRRIPIVMTLHNYRLICSGALLMRNSVLCELCVHKKIPLSGIKHKCHRDSRMQTAALTLITGIHKVIGTWRNKVDAYIAITEFGRSKFLNSSLGVPIEKIVVKANSVEDKGFSMAALRDPFFLFVGRLSEEKGIKVILSSFSGTDLKLEVIGDGPLRQEVEEAAATFSNIIYSDFKAKDYILNRMKKSRALIFASTWYEGLPTVILEAFSTGTPVIVTNLPNLNTIVSEHKNGLLFSSNSSDDLRKKLIDLESNWDHYRHLYVGARETYEQLYTDEKNYENIVNIYRQVIERTMD